MKTLLLLLLTGAAHALDIQAPSPNGTAITPSTLTVSNLATVSSMTVTTELIFSSATHVSVNTATSFNIPDSSATLINFNTTQYDTLGEFNITTASGVFTASKAGFYIISGALFSSSSLLETKIWRCDIWINNAVYRTGSRTQPTNNGGAGVPVMCNVTATARLKAGDTVGLRLFQSSGSTQQLFPSGQYNYLTIDRIP